MSLIARKLQVKRREERRGNQLEYHAFYFPILKLNANYIYNSISWKNIPAVHRTKIADIELLNFYPPKMIYLHKKKTNKIVTKYYCANVIDFTCLLLPNYSITMLFIFPKFSRKFEVNNRIEKPFIFYSPRLLSPLNQFNAIL